MSRFALAVTLTYDDSKPENRDSAAMFNYGDVSAFLMRLRSAIRRAYGRDAGGVRFIVAGEQGSRHGRCHWHLILFSDVDLTRIGLFRNRSVRLMNRDDMISRGKHVRRLFWSLWGRGFVTLQEPDQAGLSYVLKYCLKDQFTEMKSRGTMREAKAENFATGLFRMSKLPPLGQSWIDAKLQRLADLGAVLPNLQLKIPDMSGYWHPNGLLRERLIRGLVAINDRHRMDHGVDAPQWASLVASCVDSDKDMELLHDAPASEPDDEIDLARELARKGAERSRQGRISATVRNCGRKYACARCLRALDQGALERLGLEAAHREEIDGQAYSDFREVASGRWISDPQGNPLADRINAFCGLSHTERAREAFPASAS